MDNNEPSQESKDRAHHLMLGIETISGRRMRYARNRAKKAAELDMSLKNSDLTHSQKRQVQIQYFLDEAHSMRTQRANKLKMKASDFKIIKIIGKGAFGEVRIVREKNTNIIYAMKTMVKKMMNAKHQLGHVVAERDLMVDADNPWLVKLYFAFQDATYLYLVMEYCNGGDMMDLLIRENILNEKDTCFYMSELAAAINYVHKLGFVHRDLKPDNVLIGNDGHIRLSDFGLAKSFQSFNDKHLNNWQQFVSTLKPSDFAAMKESAANFAIEDDSKEEETNAANEKRVRKDLYSTVGTPDYIAIEVLYQKGYDKKVDWWSLGVIMFECLVGYAPFHGKDPLGTCRKIVRYKRYFKVPSRIKLQNNAINLMNSLVTTVRHRIGWTEIQKHPWFKDVQWERLQKYEPPFVPKHWNEADVGNSQNIEEIHHISQISADIQHCGYSTAADNTNRVFGYTFNHALSKQFQEYQRQANEAQMRIEKAKIQPILKFKV